MATHDLSTVNPYFTDTWNGIKTFEICKNDQDFQIGDIIKLKEFSPSEGYSGREIEIEIIYLIDSEEFPEGIKEGYSIMSHKIISRIAGTK